MLDERSVPSKSENESCDKDVKDEDKKLGEHVGLGLRLGNFLEHFMS